MSAAAVRIPIKSRPPKAQPEPEPRVRILEDGTVDAVAAFINNGQAKRIIVMTGAGISTAAGIKDFRSPGTGLYDDLQKYNLPFPEAVFDLAFFKESPQPFYKLAKELYPGRYRPTLTHYLLPLLAKKNLLLRSYTQNIDSLERIAGLGEDLLVEAHGSFALSKCVQCEMTSDPEWVKRHIFSSEIPYCKRCGGLVKPSITFFGENVPLKFSKMAEHDFDDCDLLIVIGTSLKVEPFNKLIAKVSPRCPRLLINREKAGQELHSGFDFDDRQKYTVQRDALFLGNCDDGVRKLASLCGWEDELQGLYDEGHAQLDSEEEKEKQQSRPAISSLDQDAEDAEDDVLAEDDPDETSTPQSSSMTDTSSLDDITLRFEKSTLLSQLEDPSPSLEATVDTADPAEKDEPAEKNISEQANTTPELESRSENACTPDDRRTAEEEEVPIKSNGAPKEEKESEKDTSTERTPPSTAPVNIAEPDTPLPSYIPVIAGTDTQAEESQEQKQEQPQTSKEVSKLSQDQEELTTTDVPIVPKEESPLEEKSTPEKKTPRSTVSGSHSVPPFVLSPLSSLSEVGFGGDTSQFIPTSTAAILGADLRQPFSTCVPVTNRLPDVSHFASAINFDSIESSDSKGHAARDGYMVWRKRRIDLDHGVVGEFRYHRGHGALAPHFLPCDRVSKRRRMV
ncbi:NAD+-dependent protein deacetylase sirtuin 2 [Entomortierella parvispora]|uniref:NAD+-dependent protein deacetylase sirtuin 2 n=1 Tax=Entomortierella parvispora TaxID=205924 RepID=A0A9P3H6U6_9FUNG|nr:NAD+-dependent protein deacetylase sirtuin 2 [Entomortierella parvispora]